MLELTVFEKTGKKNQIILIGLGVLATSALFLLFPDLSPLYYFIPLSVTLVIISVTEKRLKPAGTIILTERQVLIKTNHTEIISELSGIRNLTLKYSGYEGKRLPADFMPRFNKFSGYDNYIRIDLGNKAYEYRFLVEDEIKENQMIELIKGWGNSGFNVSNISLNI